MMIDADAVMLLQFILFIVLSNMTNVIVNTPSVSSKCVQHQLRDVEYLVLVSYLSLRSFESNSSAINYI